MYYIQTGSSNQIKLFINGMSNESDMTEYTMSKVELIKNFEKNGYKFIPIENELSVSKSDLLDYEKNIHDIYTYCIFEKCENKINKIIEDTNDVNINVKNIEANLEYFKVSTNYDLFNLLNCINVRYTNLKSLFSIKDIISFDDIHALFKDTEFVNKVYFVDGLEECELNNIVNKKEKGITVYKYKYEEEIKNEENIEEKVVYINYYIMILNGYIVSKISDVIDNMRNKPLPIKKEIEEIEDLKEIEDPKEIEEIEDPKEIEEIEDPKEEINLKVSIKNEIKKLDKKITVIKIKEYLKLLNAKSIGNKAELLERLNKLLE
jgi:hypothetical protein